MKIINLQAKGYKRLALSNIMEITYNPETELQIILGTNGCGKSSLLNIIWPAVPKTNQWESDGYLKLTLEDNGIIYTLSSIFGPKPSHSFVKGDEGNLNPGGTSTVQKSLIESEFRTDSDIHSVLTGRVKFTQMTPSKRKEWMSKLSSMDMRWLTQLYTDTQQTIRAHQQNINFINKKLMDAAEKLNSLTNQKAIDGHYENLQALLKELYALKSLPISTDILEDQLYQGMSAIDALNKLKQAPTYVLKNFKDGLVLSVSDLDKALSVKSDMALAIQNKNTLYSSQLEQLDDINNIVSESNSVNVELKPRLESELLSLDKELLSYTDQKYLKLSKLNIDLILSAIDREAENIYSIASSLPIDNERLMTHERQIILQNEISMLDKKLADCTALINQANAVLESHLKESATECPSCQHKWRPGWTDDDHEKLTENIRRLTADSDKARVSRENKSEALEKILTYRDIRMDLKALLVRTPEINDWYMDNISEDILRHTPEILNVNLGSYIEDLKNANIFKSLSDRREYVVGQLSAIEKAMGCQSAMLYSKRDMLSTSVEVLLKEKTDLAQEFKELSNWIVGWVRWQEQANKILPMVKTLNSYWEAQCSGYASDYICGCINTIETELSKIVLLVNQKKSTQAIMSELESNLVTEKNDLVASQLIEALLSPVNGIIAEQLSVSIDAVVTGINLILASIWEYPIEIQSCGIVEGDLDYRFPLLINESSSIDDVSEASSAQKDIVDFAFLLLVYQLLDLKNYPLMLDELGTSFDEIHRGNLLRYIRNGIECGDMHQVFMVSHYISQYSGFGNAEYLVLNESNITLPEVYNKHVKIT